MRASSQNGSVELRFLVCRGGDRWAAANEHGLPQHAVEIARPFGFPVTNSMVVTWIVAVALIFFARRRHGT